MSERVGGARDDGGALTATFGERASKVPKRNLPSFALRAAAPFRPELRRPAAELGYVKRLSTTRQHALLGIDPRPWQDAVLGAAGSLLERGLAA
jgi:hypothetical protein